MISVDFIVVSLHKRIAIIANHVWVIPVHNYTKRSDVIERRDNW